MCQAALQELKLRVRTSGQHKQRIQILINLDGIKIKDERSGVSPIDVIRCYYNPNSKLISSFSFLLGKLETKGSYGLGRKIRLLLKKIRQRLAPCNLLATQKHLSLIGTAEL